MPTNLLHHGPKNRAEKSAQNMAAIERPRQYDKEGALFWTSKRKKKQARKNGPPQFKIPAAAVAGQISFDLK